MIPCPCRAARRSPPPAGTMTTALDHHLDAADRRRCRGRTGSGAAVASLTAVTATAQQQHADDAVQPVVVGGDHDDRRGHRRVDDREPAPRRPGREDDGDREQHGPGDVHRRHRRVLVDQAVVARVGAVHGLAEDDAGVDEAEVGPHPRRHQRVREVPDQGEPGGEHQHPAERRIAPDPEQQQPQRDGAQRDPVLVLVVDVRGPDQVGMPERPALPARPRPAGAGRAPAARRRSRARGRRPRAGRPAPGRACRPSTARPAPAPPGRAGATAAAARAARRPLRPEPAGELSPSQAYPSCRRGANARPDGTVPRSPEAAGHRVM